MLDWANSDDSWANKTHRKLSSVHPFASSIWLLFFWFLLQISTTLLLIHVVCVCVKEEKNTAMRSLRFRWANYVICNGKFLDTVLFCFRTPSARERERGRVCVFWVCKVFRLENEWSAMCARAIGHFGLYLCVRHTHTQSKSLSFFHTKKSETQRDRHSASIYNTNLASEPCHNAMPYHGNPTPRRSPLHHSPLFSLQHFIWRFEIRTTAFFLARSLSLSLSFTFSRLSIGTKWPPLKYSGITNEPYIYILTHQRTYQYQLPQMYMDAKRPLLFGRECRKNDGAEKQA